MAGGEPTSEPVKDAVSGDGIPQGRFIRAAPFAAVAARNTGDAMVAALRRRVTGVESHEHHVRTAERYVELLGRSKGVLMKAGQTFSDMAGPAIPPAYRRAWQGAWARLQCDAPPMAPELAREVLESELGGPTGARFAKFEWEPIAAASIGQVHGARLLDGREVAVKLQYPGVARAIAADLANTELLVTFLDLMRHIVPGGLRLDMRGAAAEISARIAEELDYRVEATNQAEFAAAYRGHPFLHVPEVIGDLCTSHVLTQERVRGLRFRDALSAGPTLRDAWGEAIVRFCWDTLRREIPFHADLHPGNFLFHTDGTVSCLDFGRVKHLQRHRVRCIREIQSAAIRGDAPALWHAALDGGFFGRADAPTPEAMLEYWRPTFEHCWAAQPFTITSAYAAAAIERQYSPAGPAGDTMRRLMAPGDYAFWGRNGIGLLAVLGELRATADWSSMAAEFHHGALPQTAMGRRERAFLEARGEA